MTPAAFAVRELREADAPALARLHVTSWQETYADQLPPGFFTPRFLEQREAMWTRLSRNRPDGVAVAVAVTADTGAAGSRIIGFAAAGNAADGTAPRPTELNMLYVERRSHGTGAGQALLDSVLPLHPAFLWVARDNPRAHAFYRRNGFEADGTELADTPVPGLTSVRMVR
ncbi:N-acetyltransferase family protein [Arthrobacter sp. NPDC055585]